MIAAPAPASTAPVLIIGCGISALALATVLHYSNVPFLIFERDASLRHRHQGYRFRCLPHGLKALEEICSHDPSGDTWRNVQLSFATGIPPRIEMDAITGRIKDAEAFAKSSADERAAKAEQERLLSINKLNAVPDNRRHADRSVVRRILLEPLLPHVRFNSKLVRYETSAEGVTAYFEDGHFAFGRLLVGADGAGSRVAKQLLGDQFYLHDYGMCFIFGRTPLVGGIEEKLPEELRNSMAYCRTRLPEGLITFFTEAIRFDPDTRERHPELEIPQDYIFWGMAAQKMIHRPDALFPDTLLKGIDLESMKPAVRNRKIVDALIALSPEQRAELTLFTTRNFHPSIRTILEQQNRHEATVGHIWSADPYHLPEWDTDPHVTIMGDAFYASSATASNGANLAIMGGLHLGRNIVREWNSRNGVSKDGLREYEDAMRRAAQPIVRQVYENALLEFGAEVHPRYPEGLAESVSAK